MSGSEPYGALIRARSSDWRLTVTGWLEIALWSVVDIWKWPQSEQLISV
jgi:hypothetical protein